MVPIFAILLLCLPQLFASAQEPDPYTTFIQLDLPPGLSGPDAVAQDPSGKGPYAGSSDGRILKYNGTVGQFLDFASIFPDRPFGLSFDQLSGDLYVVGAYGGFYRVGPQGGEATLLATGVNGGAPFNFLDGVDVDWVRRVVYLTDASLVYNDRRIGSQGGNPNPGAADLTGRLIQYNITSGELKVLLDQLPVPSKPAVSADGTFLLYASCTYQQIFKYDLRGGTTSVVLDNLPGFPVKVSRAVDDEFFWVPVNMVVQQQPRVVESYGYKFNSNGHIVLKKKFTNEHSEANDVQEYDYGLPRGRSLYIGSLHVPFVGVYKTSPSVWL